MTHDELCENAQKAIDTLFGDKSVSRAQTKESLNDLVDYIEVMLDTLDD